MTNDKRNPKPECRKLSVVRSPVSSFGFGHSFGFRHSSFGFENRSLLNQMAGRRTGEAVHGAPPGVISSAGWMAARAVYHRIVFQPVDKGRGREWPAGLSTGEHAR